MPNTNENQLRAENQALRDEIAALKSKHAAQLVLLQKYQLAFQYVNDLIFVFTYTNNNIGSMAVVNQPALNFWGYSEPEIIDKDFDEVFLMNENIIQNMELPLQQTRYLEAACQNKQGELKQLELHLTHLVYNKRDYLLVVAKDITDTMLAQKQLYLAQEKAKESERLKNEFLANISHEIRTPMNAIAGFSNLLVQDNLTSDKRLNYVNIINSNTNLLLRIINDILDLSQLEAESLKIVRKKHNINQILHEAYNIFTTEMRRLNKDHIKLLYTKELADTEAFIITDPIRFSQILNNLLFNAIKFTDVGFIEYGYELNKDNKLIIYVRDSGIGIVKDKQDVIFEHFRKANQTINPKNHGGTGLGLSISKKLVEQLGGKIWVESESGQGSTFYFSHPYFKDKQPSSGVANGNSLMDWSGKTILLIDDEDEAVNKLNMALFETNISLLVARTGEEAMHLCKMNPKIDIAIINDQLPDMRGYDIANVLNRQIPNLPIILQCAEDIEAPSVVQDYILKPVSEENLLLKIYNLLRQPTP